MRMLPTRRVLGVLLLASVASAAAPADAPISRPPAPLVLESFSGQLQDRFDAAFGLALERLGSRPGCRGLYEGLARTGLESLTVTRYVRPSARDRQRVCKRGASAFTMPGGLVTRLCSSFGRLPTPRAAAVLLHEALHTAGLPERPGTPQAMSSGEINELVARSCEL